MKRRCVLAALIVWAALLGSGEFSWGANSATACAGCHPKETTRYLATAMGQSLIAPATLPTSKVRHDLSQSVIAIEERNGRMFHTLSERGLTAEYPVKYQIGGRMMGATYMVQMGDYLFESPVSWYNRYGWDVSPGYAQKQMLDFDRPMDSSCLFCHAGNARFVDPDGRRLQSTNLTSITCDRCHGATEAHVKHPSATNIINPAKLTGASRDGICEQCHLEGATRILNPGKTWSDFHAGERPEITYATYLLTGIGSKDVIAVSQAEQLARSKCVRATAGKLWCGSCHNPHSEAPHAQVDRQREIRAVCSGCHATLSANAHSPAPAECTSCHMPRSATTDIPHAALTDHRLLRHPSETEESGNGEAPKVVAWREPEADLRARDLALAEVLISFKKNVPGIQGDGLRSLADLPDAQRARDATVLSDLEGFSMQDGNLQQAIDYGRHATELNPQSATAAMNFGIVLKHAGDAAEAERQLRRAIELDPSLKQAYSELATLYASQGRKQEMSETIDRFLKWNPQDILFRLQKARAAGQ